LFLLALSGCASVPPEAAALSEQLGSRLSDIEAAHVNLVEDFFTEKRERVDDYIEAVWVPTFAREFFNDPVNQQMWDVVVASTDPMDRVIFLSMVGPALQKNINTQRRTLIEPLDMLEREVTRQLRTEYVNTRAINQSLTAYLHTASELGENRQRYLDKLGLEEEHFNDFIDHADTAVTMLIDQTDLIRDHAAGVATYRESLQSLLIELGL
ncbi:MAG: hypothetical protein V3U76_00085, partial [Granulosicoccus sp.]